MKYILAIWCVFFLFIVGVYIGQQQEKRDQHLAYDKAWNEGFNAGELRTKLMVDGLGMCGYAQEFSKSVLCGGKVK